MTVKECYDIFLRHIDRATSGGKALEDRKKEDFKDKFLHLLNPALEYICSIMNPVKKFNFTLEDGSYSIRLPDDFYKIIRVRFNGEIYTDYYMVENVMYSKSGNGFYEIVYSYISKLPGDINDNDVIDIPRRCEMLLPLKIASDCIKTEDSALSAYLMNIFNSEIENLCREKGFFDNFKGLQRLFSID